MPIDILKSLRGSLKPRFLAALRPWVSFSLMAFLATQSTGANAQSPAAREYQLKAVFLFNFAQFTQWPTNAFTNSESPIVIGILGIDPFGEILDETVRGETVNGRKLVIERYRRLEEIESCHILFISQSEMRRADRILESLRGKSILTVGDMEPSVGRRLAMRFVPENNKLRIRINIDSVSEAHLTISSKLLRAAEIVPSERAP